MTERSAERGNTQNAGEVVSSAAPKHFLLYFRVGSDGLGHRVPPRSSQSLAGTRPGVC